MSTQSVFLFPGQGSQSVGMGKDFYYEFPEFAETFDEASDTLGFNMKTLCFEDPHGQLKLTEFTQPAILTVSTGIFRVLKNRSCLMPQVVAGHSLGEYSALVALGAFKFSDALQAVHFRGQAMQRAVPVGLGGMIAYLGNFVDQIRVLCTEISTPNHCIEIANDNSPTQLVISGHSAAIEQLSQIIVEKKLGRAIKLSVSAPFHSSLMKPAAEEMSQFFKKMSLNRFKDKIVANIDAKLHTDTDYTFDILTKQISYPVLWTQSMHCIHETQQIKNVENPPVWIEVGPGRVLQGLVKKTYENKTCLSTSEMSVLKNLFEF